MTSAARVIFAALAPLLLSGPACRSKKSSPPDAALGSGKSFPSDTPPAQACTTDADCTVIANGPLGSDPCCEITVTAMSVSHGYLRFMADFKRQHCGGVKCEPLTLPGALPAKCAFEPRCKDRKCGNACGETPSAPTAPVPEPVRSR